MKPMVKALRRLHKQFVAEHAQHLKTAKSKTGSSSCLECQRLWGKQEGVEAAIALARDGEGDKHE